MPIEGFVPHPPEVAARWRELGYWQDRTLFEEYAERFSRYASRTALVGEEGDSLTYRDLETRATRLARNLYDLGLRPLDRVIIQLPNVPELMVLYLALQRIGAIPLMALQSHRYMEISQFTANSGAVAIATPVGYRSFSYLEMVTRITHEQDSLRWGLVLGRIPVGTEGPFVDLQDLEERPPSTTVTDLDALELDPDEPAVLQLSGGTTGVPKLIPRTHNDYALNSRLAVAATEVRPDDALLVVLPAAHNLPLACPGMQGFLFSGARAVMSRSARPEHVFALVQEHAITHIHVVPALLIAWLNSGSASDYDLSSVRIIQSGGQRLQPKVREATVRLFPNCTVQENFGMSEGVLMFVRLGDPEDVWRETCGRPVCPHDEVRLVDDEDREVPAGNVGEMICRGPYTIRGYFRADEHNARAFTKDGFYRSGDLMRLHPSGNYIVAGRKKDLINRGGEKISAEEVENLILSHPSVMNVACVPVPDERLGERMCACVILQDSAELDFDGLVQHLMSKEIAKFKLPERLEIFEDFPLSGFGKVSKKDLVNMVADRDAQMARP